MLLWLGDPASKDEKQSSSNMAVKTVMHIAKKVTFDFMVGRQILELALSTRYSS